MAAFAGCTAALGIVAATWQATWLLYLLMVPVFAAATVYPRPVSLMMQLIAMVVVIIVVQGWHPNPARSMREILFISSWVLAISEILHRLKVRREQLDAAIRESERRFHALIENSADGIGLFDSKGTVLYASSAITRILGHLAHEVVGTNIFSHAHVEDSALLTKKLEELVGRPGATVAVQLRSQHKNGTWVWIEATMTNLLGEPGVQAIVANYRDISERRHAEIRTAAFLKLGHQLSAANTPKDAARIIVGVTREILRWDACALSLFLEEQNCIQPLVSIDTIDGQQVDVDNSAGGKPPSPGIQRVIQSGAELILRDGSEVCSKEFTPFGDAKRRSASLLFVPIRDGTKVIGVLSIQSYSPNAYHQGDLITLQALADHCGGALERLRAVEELRRSEERFSKAFGSSPVPIAITSLREDRFLNVNESLVRLVGYDRKEILGRTVAGLGLWVDPEQRERLRQTIQEQHSVRELACKFRTKPGTLREVLASAELFELGGEPCVLETFQDITDRLNLEAQLLHSQKMEAVGQLSAGVAHDFNNLLTVILGSIDLLMARAKMDAESRESMKRVAMAAERAANLTAQLLTFSRKRRMRQRPVELSEVIANAGAMLRSLLGESIELQFNHPGRLPPVHADPGMLEQVIINLGLNAKDAMPAGGKFLVNLAAVELEAASVSQYLEARPGSFVCLTVTDTGCGMDAQTLARIFEPFFTSKAVGQGTGLGLAMVYGIIKQHEGWIEVASQPGFGTTFRIFLPVSTEAAKPPVHSTPTKDVTGGTETILVVEDEPALRELIREILGLYGYRVVEAANGREALQVWSRQINRIDLLLTDLVMPGEPSGIDLARRLKTEDPLLKVIYTSGYSVDWQVHSPVLCEGASFLPKPYDPLTLAATVRKCLDAGQG